MRTLNQMLVTYLISLVGKASAYCEFPADNWFQDNIH